jgi:hypothetical protein
MKKTVLTVRMNADWRNAIVAEAMKRGQTITNYVCGVLIGNLPENVRDSLSEAQTGQPGRPAKIVEVEPTEVKE